MAVVGARRRNPYKVLLHEHQSPGDVLVSECAIHSICEQHKDQFVFRVTGTCCPDIFLHNPNVKDFDGEPDIMLQAHYPGIHRSNQSDITYPQAFTEYLCDKLNIKLYNSCNHPHIYLSDEEKARPRRIEGRYVVVNAGTKRDYPVKQWPWSNWQTVVDWCVEKGWKVVQVGSREKDHIHRDLKNVVNLIGQTQNIRDFFLLVYHADLCLSHESFLHHIAAAFEKPCVCVASGWNPAKWASYGSEIYITKRMHCRPMNGGCWLGNHRQCRNFSVVDNQVISDCMSAIPASNVIDGIMEYVNGKVLSLPCSESATATGPSRR